MQRDVWHGLTGMDKERKRGWRYSQVFINTIDYTLSN